MRKEITNKDLYPIVDPILNWVLGSPEKTIDEESVWILAEEIFSNLKNKKDEKTNH